MQIPINKDIRRYQEEIFMGLTLRQLLCSGIAIGLAVLIYLWAKPLLGQETASWLCILAAAPIAAAGFLSYDGLPFEKFVMSSNFLYSSWKRFRKYNAYATGISQDIQDYLDNPVAYALLSNSEFVIMLRQSKSLEALERLYGLSKPQLEFLRNASEGHGILKMGNSMIPFSNLEPKDTAVYKLITTKPGEATAEK